MSYDKAHLLLIIRSLASNDDNQIIKGLNELKLKSIDDLMMHQIFRMKDFVERLMHHANSKNSHIQNLTLSLFCSYSLCQDFIVEGHNYGLRPLLIILERTKSKVIQQKLLRFFCRQMRYEPSRTLLYQHNLMSFVISVIKGCETDEAKYYGIKILRMLSTSREKIFKLLSEKGLYVICSEGLSLTCRNLLQLTMQFVMFLHKKNITGPLYFEQLISGSQNLELFMRIYEYDEKYKYDIFDLFLNIFSHHFHSSSIQQYSRNIIVLDFLCMANLPVMLVHELKSGDLKSRPKILGCRKMILTLCGFCELGDEWRLYSCNVLPTYYNRAWMQISDVGGIEFLITLMIAHQNDRELLQSVLRAVLGLEKLHSNKLWVLNKFMKVNILTIIAKLFDRALDCIGNSVTGISNKCSHYKFPEKLKRRLSTVSSKLIPQDMLNFISTTENLPVTENLPEKLPVLCHADRVHLHSKLDIERGVDSAAELISTTPQVVTGYKELNKIKFRTGSGNRQKRVRAKSLNQDGKSDQRIDLQVKRMLSFSGSGVRQPDDTMECSPSSSDFGQEKCNQEPLDETTQYWVTVLEYLVRLLYQIFIFKDDVKVICKEFLPRIYSYLASSCIVHESAILILSHLAKNTSCIQLVLDMLFIPMLIIDLEDVIVSKGDCDHCNRISKGVAAFLDKIGFFFCHFHQYGSTEMMCRLNPSKDPQIKYSSLVAVAHVTRCPKRLYEFFIEYRGLDQLFHLISSSVTDGNMHSYGIASISKLMENLKDAFDRKYYKNCIFCETNFVQIPDTLPDISHTKKNQLLALTNSNFKEVNRPESSKCKIRYELNKDCRFKLCNGKLIEANRERLAMENEVLRTMLQGSFSESRLSCVEIKDVNSRTMEMLLHFVYGCTCDVYVCEDPDTYIELLFVAQMYFIPELQILAVHHLSQLMPIHDVRTFLLRHPQFLNKNILQHLFCWLLSQPGSVTAKVKWVDLFLEVDDQIGFTENIKEGLKNLLDQISDLCNCDVFYDPIH